MKNAIALANIISKDNNLQTQILEQIKPRETSFSEYNKRYLIDFAQKSIGFEL